MDFGKIEELVKDTHLLKFAEFVISGTEAGNLPDYKAMDLMKVPQLVPYIWVFDFRNGLEDGLIFHFSGTKVDALFERNVTGLDFEKIYPGEHYKELIEGSYHQAYLQKRPCYTRRLERYADEFIDKVKMVETVMFPCSSDNDTINFGLGMTKYTFAEEEHAMEFLLL